MCAICEKYRARHLAEGEAIVGAVLDTTRIITDNSIETVIVVQPDPVVLHIRGWSQTVSREWQERIAKNRYETAMNDDNDPDHWQH